MKLIFTLFLAFIVPASSFAQEFAEGVGNTIDKKRRSPVISLSTDNSNGIVKILADAYVPNQEYEQYPIRFDFFVNGKQIDSQVRSKELPRPVGIDVTPEIAIAPFNYQIIATLLHPNRQFVSMAQGAVYATDLSSTLSCTLSEQTLDGELATINDFTNQSVSVTQSGESAITLQFVATGAETLSDNTREVSASLSLETGDTSNGTVTVDSNEPTVVSGTVVNPSSGISDISVGNEDGSVTLTCVSSSSATSTQDQGLSQLESIIPTE